MTGTGVMEDAISFYTAVSAALFELKFLMRHT